jgi:hypothetical protein
MLEQILSLRLLLGMLAYAALILISWLMQPTAAFLPLAAIAGRPRDRCIQGRVSPPITRIRTHAIPSAFTIIIGSVTAIVGCVLLYLDAGLLVLFAASACINLLATVSGTGYSARGSSPIACAFRFRPGNTCRSCLHR